MLWTVSAKSSIGAWDNMIHANGIYRDLPLQKNSSGRILSISPCKPHSETLIFTYKFWKCYAHYPRFSLAFDQFEDNVFHLHAQFSATNSSRLLLTFEVKAENQRQRYSWNKFLYKYMRAVGEYSERELSLYFRKINKLVVILTIVMFAPRTVQWKLSYLIKNYRCLIIYSFMEISVK